MADWNEPVNSSFYTTVLEKLKERDLDIALLNRNPSNIPNDFFRFTVVSGSLIKPQRYNLAGAIFVDLTVDMSGGGTGATTAAGARTNLGIGDMATQSPAAVNITGGTIASTTLGATNNINAAALTSGTIPDARFPATLPAISGVNLTNLTSANLSGALPAISGAALTNLNASNLASGTVNTARLGSGTANSTTFLRGDNTWASISAPDGIPTGLIAIFDTSCPAGWTRVASFDGKFLRGAAAAGATGGSASHGHNLTGSTGSAGSHSHSVNGPTSSAGAHDHGGSTDSAGIPTSPINYSPDGSNADGVDGGGDHSHTITQQAAHAHDVALNTNSAGDHTHDNAGSTDAQDHLPPWIEVVFCKKD